MCARARGMAEQWNESTLAQDTWKGHISVCVCVWQLTIHREEN